MPDAATPAVPGLVDHLFRHESGRMVAALTRVFGTEHLGLAEDVVQEALGRALRTWPFQGVPENPPAWLMRTARNLALDTVRRRRAFREREAELVRIAEEESPASTGTTDSDAIADDRLRLMFVCCHPLLAPEAQAMLVLRTLCGFGPAEISRAFLTTEAAVLKRLTRAKEQIRDARLPFEIPEGAELEKRLDGVLRSLYLLFNEGHAPSRGENPVRAEICEEALRLAALLAAHPAGNRPPTHALLALLLFGAARLPARVDDGGNLLLIQEQDRTRWDGERIARGLRHLALSASGGEITAYHCQAGIAASHMTAPDYASTDWAHIVALYDHLSRIAPSPVVALNRAVAVANLRGPVSGLGAVAAIPEADRAKLARYPHFHSVLGELASRCHDLDGAAAHFTRALGLAEARADRTLLEKKLAALSPASTLN